eukprot:scaffold6861_cov120-Isochrysis_galbana.AAC.7
MSSLVGRPVLAADARLPGCPLPNALKPGEYVTDLEALEISRDTSKSWLRSLSSVKSALASRRCSSASLRASCASCSLPMIELSAFCSCSTDDPILGNSGLAVGVRHQVRRRLGTARRLATPLVGTAWGGYGAGVALREVERSGRQGELPHLPALVVPLEDLAHKHERCDSDVDRHRGEPLDEENGDWVAGGRKRVDERSDHDPDEGHLQKLPEDEGDRLALRVARVHVARPVAQVDAELDQRQLDGQQRDRVGRRPGGQQVARAVPDVEVVAVEDLDAVVRWGVYCPSGEQRHVQEHQRAHVPEEDGQGDPNVAHCGVDEQLRHPPKLGDHGAKDERVAQEVAPHLLDAAAVEVWIPSAPSDGDRVIRHPALVVPRGHQPAGNGQAHTKQDDELELRLRGLERGAPVEGGPDQPREQHRHQHYRYAPHQAHQPRAQIVALDLRLKPALPVAAHLEKPLRAQLRRLTRQKHHIAQSLWLLRLGLSRRRPLDKLDRRPALLAVGPVELPPHQEHHRSRKWVAAGGGARGEEELMTSRAGLSGGRAGGSGEARRHEMDRRIERGGERRKGKEAAGNNRARVRNQHRVTPYAKPVEAGGGHVPLEELQHDLAGVRLDRRADEHELAGGADGRRVGFGGHPRVERNHPRV